MRALMQAPRQGKFDLIEGVTLHESMPEHAMAAELSLGVDHDAGQMGRHRNVCMLVPSAPCEAKLTICNGLLRSKRHWT